VAGVHPIFIEEVSLTRAPTLSTPKQSVDGVVFVVDDDVSMREALSSLIRSVGVGVETFGSAQEFLRRRRSHVTACLVLDVGLPGSMSGLDLQKELARLGDRIPIIFITADGDIPMSVTAMKAGAVEFLPKPFRDEDLLAAVDQALERSRAGVQHAAERSTIQSRYESLTLRERQVLERIVNGRLNKQTAAELDISEITVKVHRRHVMQKMCATSLAHLVRITEKLR
jgi:FixJ family two-component response regulator